MALEIQPKEVAKPAVQLVLAGALKRFTRNGRTFTDQKIYTCTQEQALELLSWEIDESPVFKRYKKEKRKADEYVPASERREEALEMNPAVERAQAAAKAGIELGTDEELAELGLDKIDEQEAPGGEGGLDADKEDEGVTV